MNAEEVTVYTDGASRGNPGAAAAAFVVLVDGVQVLEYAEPIGRATNNVAEYEAMIRALKCCRSLGVKVVHLNSDSELMVKQMRGEYRVKHPDMQPLYEEAQGLVSEFRRVTFRHVPRKENAEADRLGNEALDGKPTPLPLLDGRVAPKPAARPAPASSDAAEAKADELRCIIESARAAWSGGSDTPTIDEVCGRIAKLMGRRSKPAAGRRPRGPSRED